MDSEIEIYDFSTGDEFSDFKLIVQDKPILVHKAILANASIVFRKMFTTQFREKATNEAVLPGKKFDEILELLKLIYPNYEKTINESNSERLLQLSDEYHIISVKNQVEKSLISTLKTDPSPNKKLYGKAIENRIEQVTKFLSLADVYGLKKLWTESVENLVVNFSRTQLEANAHFELVDERTKLEIFRRKVTMLEDKLKQKDECLKKLQDECLRQKFELKNFQKNEQK